MLMKFCLRVPAMLLLAAAVLAGCSGSKDRYKGDPLDEITEYTVVKIPGEGDNVQWGFMSRNGDVIPANLTDQPFHVTGGVFAMPYWKPISERISDGSTSEVVVRRTALYEFDGVMPTLIPGCDSLADVGIFNCGVIPVVHPGQRITLLRKDGSRVCELGPVDGMEISECSEMFNEGLLAVCRSDRKWGYVDTLGNVVIPFEYTDAGIFSNGVAVVATPDGQQAISHEGTKLFDIDNSSSLLGFFAYGRKFMVDNLGCLGYLDLEGKFNSLDPTISEIYDYNADCFVYGNDTGKGVMKYSGEELVPAGEYKRIILLANGSIVGAKTGMEGGELHLLDSDGDEILVAPIDDVLDYKAGFPLIVGNRIYDYDFNPIPQIDIDTNGGIYLWSAGGTIDSEYSR